MTDKDEKRKLAVVALFLAAVLCLLAYGMAAWFFRLDLDADLASVQSQVLEIADGTARPIFSESPSGPGALELYANALTFRLFGQAPLALSLGTLLLSLLALFHMARLAGRAAGPLGAATALLFSAAAPIGFLRLAVTPLGGNGLHLLCALGLLDLGSLLLLRAREGAGRRGKPYPVLPVLLAGLYSGIAIWCAPAALAATASVLLVLLLLAPRFAAKPIFWGLMAIGFFLGSSPLWGAFLSGSPVPPLLPRVVVDGPSVLLNASGLFRSWSVLLAPAGISPWLSAGLLLVALTPLLPTSPRPPRPNDYRTPADHAPGETLFLLFAYLAFSLPGALFRLAEVPGSPVALLVLPPVLAVFFGLRCVRGASRPARLLTWAVLLLLVFWNVAQTSASYEATPGRERLYARATRATRLLREAGTRAAYAPQELQAFGSASPGGTLFADPRRERRGCVLLALDRDGRPAVVSDDTGATDWAIASGGSATVHDVDGLSVATDLRPPSGAVGEIPPGKWLSATNRHGAQLRARLTDRSTDRPIHLAEDERLAILLKEPLPVTGIRLHGQAAPFLKGFALYGRPSTNLPFHRLTPLVPETGFAWSGPRPYFYEAGLVREARFQAESLVELELRFSTCAETPCGEVYDLQLLSPGEEAAGAAGGEDAIASLVSLLLRQGVRRLYAGRWISNRVSASTQGAIWTDRERPPVPGDGRARRLELDRSTAILMEKAGVPSLREVLRLHGFLMREIEIAPFGVLFLPETNQELPLDDLVPTAIALQENYALSIPDNGWIRRQLEADEEPHAAAFLRRLYRVAPSSTPLLEALLFVAPSEEDRRRLRETLYRQVIPEVAKDTPSDFGGGLVWRGLRLLPPETTANPEGLLVRSYWSAPAARFGRSHDLTYTLSAPDAVPPVTSLSFTFPVDPRDYDLADGEGDRFWHVDSFLPLPRELDGHSHLRLSFSLAERDHPARPLPVHTDLPTRRNQVILDDVSALPRTSYADRFP